MPASNQPFWARIISGISGNPGSREAYAVFTEAYDREVEAKDLDSVLGRLTGPSKDAFESSCEAFETGLAAWRTRFDIACIEAADRIAGRLSIERRRDTVVTFLVDHSGSMKGQRLLMAAATVCGLADCLGGLAIKTEVLGFTTVSWRGGRARRDWMMWRRRHPGRLCELLHVIYRGANDSNPGVPWSIRQMLRPDLPKENVDGEAVEWAAGRLRQCKETNKAIVVVSDGAPVDDSTIVANDGAYLPSHLKHVVDNIEAEGDIAIGAVDICSGYARHSYSIVEEVDVVTNLGDATLALVERLIAPAPKAPVRDKSI